MEVSISPLVRTTSSAASTCRPHLPTRLLLSLVQFQFHTSCGAGVRANLSRNVIAGAAEAFEACFYPVDGVHEGHGLAEGIVEGRALFGRHAW